jgi:hypothetical protein
VLRTEHALRLRLLVRHLAVLTDCHSIVATILLLIRVYLEGLFSLLVQGRFRLGLV